MQKWEYLFLSRANPWQEQGTTRINADPDSSSKQTIPEFFEECSRLGNEGWELVGLVYESRLFLLTFKRPKE